MATGLSNLANVEFELGRYSEAKAHQERALAIYEKARGPDHPQLAYPLHNLVDLALAEGRAEDAVALAERALKLHVTGGSSADELGEAEFYLARAPSEAGQSQQAVAAAERACEQSRGVDAEALAEVEAWLATHR